MNIFCNFQDAKQSLMAKLTETSEMLEELDGCINDLESGMEQFIHFLYAIRNCLAAINILLVSWVIFIFFLNI